MELETLVKKVKVAFSGVQATLPINPRIDEVLRFERSTQTVDCAAVACYCGKTHAVTQKSLCEHPEEGTTVKYQLHVKGEVAYLRSSVLG